MIMYTNLLWPAGGPASRNVATIVPRTSIEIKNIILFCSKSSPGYTFKTDREMFFHCPSSSFFHIRCLRYVLQS